MTKRTSVRAQAREIYCNLASQEASTATNTAPNPPSQSFGGQAPSGEGLPSLTEKARALYEDSAVPVREIARLAGVAERTIYKYVAKQNWKRRYARVTKFAADSAPVRGAGSRFIRREDEGLPVALGLKTTDPEGAARAQAACQEAERLSGQAQAKAKRIARAEGIIQAIDWTGFQIRQFTEFLAEHPGLRQRLSSNVQPGQAQPNGAAAIDERAGRLFIQMVNMPLARLNALLAEEAAEQRVSTVIPPQAGIQ